MRCPSSGADLFSSLCRAFLGTFGLQLCRTRPCQSVARRIGETKGWRIAYRVGLVGGARKVDHAIEAGKSSAIALVAMAIELLLCEDVSTALDGQSQLPMHV